MGGTLDVDEGLTGEGGRLGSTVAEGYGAGRKESGLGTPGEPVLHGLTVDSKRLFLDTPSLPNRRGSSIKNEVVPSFFQSGETRMDPMGRTVTVTSTVLCPLQMGRLRSQRFSEVS